MDIKDKGKKIKSFAPALSVALVTACVAGSLSGYEAHKNRKQKRWVIKGKM